MRVKTVITIATTFDSVLKLRLAREKKQQQQQIDNNNNNEKNRYAELTIEFKHEQRDIIL